MRCGAKVVLSERDPPSYAVVRKLSKCRKPLFSSALCLRSVEPLPSKLAHAYKAIYVFQLMIKKLDHMEPLRGARKKDA